MYPFFLSLFKVYFPVFIIPFISFLSYIKKDQKKNKKPIEDLLFIFLQALKSYLEKWIKKRKRQTIKMNKKEKRENKIKEKKKKYRLGDTIKNLLSQLKVIKMSAY